MPNWFPASRCKRPQLGPLETHLLGALSRRKEATVRDLLDAGEVRAAYTTIMTTLDRLFKKGFLDRASQAGSRAFVYRLNQSEREIYQTVLGANLNRLLGAASNPSVPVSFLVDTLTEYDAGLLEELGRAVNRKRRELRRREKR